MAVGRRRPKQICPSPRRTLLILLYLARPSVRHLYVAVTPARWLCPLVTATAHFRSTRAADSEACSRRGWQREDRAGLQADNKRTFGRAAWWGLRRGFRSVLKDDHTGNCPAAMPLASASLNIQTFPLTVEDSFRTNHARLLGPTFLCIKPFQEIYGMPSIVNGLILKWVPSGLIRRPCMCPIFP